MLDIATLGIGLETKSLERGQRALDDLQRQGNKTADALDGTGKRGSAAMGKVATSATAAGVASQTAFGKMVTGATGAAGAFQRLQAAALPALAAAFGGAQVIQAADAYTKFTAQIRLATDSQAQYNQALRAVQGIATASQSETSAIAALYTRIANTTKQAGVSLDQVGKITETVSLALKASGASAGEASSAMLQLSQAFASGVLRGEEFNAVSEAAFPLMKALADSMGIPVESLRTLASEGKITRDELVRAFTDPQLLESFRNQADQVTTLSGAFTVLGNALTDLVGKSGEATGATNTLAKSISDLAGFVSQNQEGIRTFFGTFASAAVVGGIGLAAVNIGKVTTAVQGLTIAAAAAAKNPLVLALFGLTSLAAAAAYAEQQTKDIEKTLTDQTKIAELSKKIAQSEKDIAEAQKEGGNRLFVIEEQRRLNQMQSEYNALVMANAGLDRDYKAEWVAGTTKQTELQKLFADAEYEALMAGLEAQNQRNGATKSGIDLNQQYIEQLKSFAESVQSVIDSEATRTKILEEQLKLGRELTETEKQHIENVQKYGKAVADGLKDQADYNELLREQANAQTAAAKAAQDVIDGARDRVRSIEDQIRAIEEETAKIGLSTEALNALEIAKLDDVIATKQQRIEMLSYGDANDELIAQYRAEIAELQKLKGAKQGLFNAQAVEQEKQAFEQFAGKILDAFSKGTKQGLRSLREMLKRQAFEFFLSPKILGGALSSLAGAFGFGNAANSAEGAAGAVSQASGLGSIVSGVKSVYDVISGGFSSFTAATESAIIRFGDTLAVQSNQTISNLGGTLSSNATLISQSITGLGIALGGRSLGGAISNGFSLNGGSGNGTVNTGAVAGAITGGIIGLGNPIAIGIGSAIGSVIGGTVNRLFGRKRVLGASGVEGDFDQFGLSNARGFQDVKLKGGVFRSDKNFTEYFGIDTKAIDAVNQAFLDVRQSVEMASNALSADFAGGLANLNLTGRLGGDLQAVLSNASDALVKEIIQVSQGINSDFLEFLEGIKQESEKLVDTFVRVSRGVSTANRAMLLLGRTAQFSIRNAEDALGIITSLGDNGLQLLDQFVQAFVPVEQQFERQVALFDQTVRELGLSSKVSINTTREEFAKLVQSIDLTTAAGQRELALLLQIMPQLNTLIAKREQENAAVKALSASIEANVQRIRGDFQGLLDAIALRTDTTSLRITQAINSITAQPVIEFAAAISNAKPTDTVYRSFITTVGQLQPSVGQYMKFVDSISGFTPNTAAYRAFTDAVSGIKPTDVAYKQFIASVQGLKPSEALYKAFIDAVSAAKPSSTAFGGFVADVQAKTNLANQAIGLLSGQIDQLQDVVVAVNFSNFTSQISKVNADIVRLGMEASSTTDVSARLQLEDQLQQAIVSRYELEQQMLGGVFATLQELFTAVKGERVAVREAAIGILGGRQVLTPAQIRSQAQVALPNLPSIDRLRQLSQQVDALQPIVSQTSQNFETSLKNGQKAFNALESLFTTGTNSQLLNGTLGAYNQSAYVAGLSQEQRDQQDIKDFQFFYRNALASLAEQGGSRFNFGVGRNSQGQFTSDFDFLQAYQNPNSTFNGQSATDFFNANKNNANANPISIGAALAAILSGQFDQAVAQLKTNQNAYVKALNDREALVKAEIVEQEKFVAQLQQFQVDATKATQRLSRLREETVRYYQEQERLVGALTTASQGLRQTVADIRFADLNPQQQLAKLQGEFAALFNQSKTLSGDALAAVGTDLNALINPILQKAGEVFASGSQFQSIKDAILSQAETVATRIEQLTPVNYQQESLALLDTIDQQLALIESNTASAETLIVQAIGLSADRTVAALAEIYRGITGTEIPAFAKGGMHSGGIRLVGERGPELEVTGPSRIIPNNQLMGMMRGNDNTEVVAELREANRLMQQQMRIMQATAQQNANDNAEMKQELQTLRKKVALEASQ